jgi:ribonuclease P protein component
MIRALERRAGCTRLGVAVSRKVGKACVRNRIKRMIREYFRLNKHKLPPKTDLVFVARPNAWTLKTSELRTELDNFFDKQ